MPEIAERRRTTCRDATLLSLDSSLSPSSASLRSSPLVCPAACAFASASPRKRGDPQETPQQSSRPLRVPRAENRMAAALVCRVFLVLLLPHFLVAHAETSSASTAASPADALDDKPAPQSPPVVRWRQTPSELFITVAGAFKWPRVRFRSKGLHVEGIGSVEGGEKKKYLLDLALLREIDPTKSSFIVKSRGIEIRLEKKKQEPCWRSLGPLFSPPPPFLKREFVDRDSELCYMARIVWRGKFFWERKFADKDNTPGEQFFEDHRPTGVHPDLWNKIIRDLRRRAVDPSHAREDASLQAEIAAARKI
ncbi:CS domain protein [Toxoplasma gondii VAND]|uniref:CS domain protein n=2 Tax=Toxoplasma gondii TaxID=5811 RepID=A0A2T6IX14_TOXGO|nr:CS domain protein [Toxoplasma gondii VAND]PUA89882.1 CS domain protein [Toxoplasma gondii TgCATBr9]